MLWLVSCILALVMSLICLVNSVVDEQSGLVNKCGLDSEPLAATQVHAVRLTEG
jgi:hypothetical protein